MPKNKLILGTRNLRPLFVEALVIKYITIENLKSKHISSNGTNYFVGDTDVN